MVKYFICDLDGTLVRRKAIFDEHQNIIQFRVTDEDKAAVAAFIAQGGQFIIATGRADFEIENFMKLEAIGPVSYRISCNGAMIRTQAGEIELHERISDEGSQLVREQLKVHADGLHVIEASDIDWVYYHGQADHEDIYKDQHIWPETDVVETFGETIFPIKYYLKGEKTAIQALITAAETTLPTTFEVFDDLDEVNLGPKGVSKGTAVTYFMEQHGIDPSEIAVIGDAANDIAMFGTTPNSFSFQHAAPHVQKHANYLVETVAEAIEHVLKANARCE